MDNKNEIINYITTKLFTIPYVNSKGYKIGNYIVYINKDKLPFSSTDQVDNFLVNLFNYAQEIKKKTSQVTTKDFNKRFFKNHKDPVVSFIPIAYKADKSDKNVKGGKSKKRTMKNRTMKNRSRNNYYKNKK